MSFPRYPKYKASGVQWLGEVPEHWEVKRLKWQITEVENRAGDEELELLGLSKVHGVIPRAQLEQNAQESNDYSKYRVANVGELVMNRMQAWNGVFGLSPQKGMVSPDYAVFHFLKPESAAYLTQLFRTPLMAGVFFTRCRGMGTAFLRLNTPDLLDILVPLPPLPEQTAIAAFLDRETSKIDALVAEQRRLMELLKEKRQAVISHAVTRGLPPEASAKAGLNPKTMLKPSSIEWLREVPQHWKTVQVKHLARPGKKTFTDGDWIEAPFVTDEGVRLIQTGNIGIGFYKEQGYRYVSYETFEKLNCTDFMPGDVLICRLDGPVGRACLAPDLGVRMITSVDNAILKCSDDVVPEYIVAILSSVPWLSWIDALCRVGGGFRLRISRSQLGEIRVPIPPQEEQLAIVAHLKSVTASFDTLTAEAQRAIDLLQERRTALISAAVTGQIDVRQLTEKMSA